MKFFKTIGSKNQMLMFLKEEITKVVLEHFRADTINELPKEANLEARLMIKQLLLKERLKVKKNWKEFKNLIEPLERRAFKIALIDSKVLDYYMEQGTDIIALPKEAMKLSISKSLQILLEKNDLFGDMEKATIIALARYAIYMQFNNIFKSFKNQMELLCIEDSIYILADEINNDFYYTNDDSNPNRNDMLFFAKVNGLSLELDKKEIEEKCQEALGKWKRFIEKRQEDRQNISRKDRITWDTPQN